MFIDLKLADKMHDVASMLQYETEEVFFSIESASISWQELPQGKRHYKHDSDQDAVDMGLDDLDYADDEYLAAAKQIERTDRYLRKLLQLRKQFGDETGFHFNMES